MQGAISFIKSLSSPRRLLLLGMLLFIASRLWLIWAGALTAETTRNGGDGLTYLWRCHNIQHGYSQSHPALLDIISQVEATGDEFDAPEDWRLHVHYRLLGTSTPLFDAIGWLALKLSPHWAISYAIMESTAALTLMAGCTLLLHTLYGARAAGLALLLLSFIVLPRQGIDTLIANHLSLGFGLLAMGVLFTDKLRLRPLLLFICFLLSLLAHKLGLVLICGTITAAGFTALFSERSWKDRIVSLLPTLIPAVLAVVAAQALSVINGNMNIPATYHGLHTSIDGIWENTRRGIKIVYDSLRKNPTMLILLLFSFASCREAWSGNKRKAALLAVLTMLAASLPHNIIGFKADLFGRLSIALVIIFCGAAARTGVSLLPSRPILSGFLACLYIWGAALWIERQSSEQLHYSWYSVHNEILSDEINSLPTDNGIAYLDGEWALQSALTAGAAKRHAVWAPAFKDGITFTEKAASLKADLLLAAPPRALTAVSMIRPTKLMKRSHSFPFELLSSVHLDLTKEHGKWSLLLENDSNDPITLIITEETISGDGRQIAPQIQPGKHTLALPTWATDNKLRFMAPEQKLLLTGIKSDTQNHKLNWPWCSTAKLEYVPNWVRGPLYYRVDFSLQSILNTNHAEYLLPELANIKAVSDQSGMIMLAAPEITKRMHP